MRLGQAVRALRATPGITTASIVILALGIGASTVVFSVVNGLLLRPLPVTAQDRLVHIWKNDVERGFDHYPLTYPEYVEWSRRSRTFESLAALSAWDGLLLGSGEAVRIKVSLVSGNLFEVLEASSHVGRTLRSEDDRETAVPPLVLSHRVWSDRFGSDPSILGKTLPLRLPHAQRTSFQVVGVMPEAFDLFDPTEAWAPVMAVQPEWNDNEGCECDLIGRIASDSTPERALAELQTIHETLASEQPDDYRSIDVVLVPLLESVVGQSGPASVLTFGAAGLLLAIAIANVAGLSLIRALGRTREVAIRSALGARTASLIRERLTESLLISSAALTGGIVVAHLGIEVLLILKGADLPRVQEIALDSRALLFSIGIAALATAICALLPLLFGTPESLKSRRGGASHGRPMQWMVIAEIALALPLLFASGLLVRTLLTNAAIDRGFDTEKLLALEVQLPPSKYGDPESRLALIEELVRRIEALPGIASATAIPRNPGSGTDGVTGPLAYEGQLADEARDNPMTNLEMVAPNYFAVLGIPVIRGRAFSQFDRLETEHVAIVSAEVATTYWPGQDPIGKTLAAGEISHRVVGVAGDTRYRELTRPWPTVYFPIRQNPFSQEPRLHPFLTPGVLAIRTRLPPDGLVSSIRSAIRSLDEEISLGRAATMEDLLDLELRAPRFHAAATSSFSFIALLLAAAGVYSVFAAFVAQRLPELGIRSALGATPARLRSLVLNRSRNLVLMGIGAGGIGAFFLSRLLGTFLYSVAPFDLPTFFGAAALLGAVSLAATYVPARRAARIDPLSVLKHE